MSETLIQEGLELAAHLPEGTIHRAMATEIKSLRADLEQTRDAERQQADKITELHEDYRAQLTALRAELAQAQRALEATQRQNAVCVYANDTLRARVAELERQKRTVTREELDKAVRAYWRCAGPTEPSIRAALSTLGIEVRDE